MAEKYWICPLCGRKMDPPRITKFEHAGVTVECVMANHCPHCDEDVFSYEASKQIEAEIIRKKGKK